MKRFFIGLLFICFAACCYAQTTYTWIGATGASWTVAANWSPTRTTPAATDIIVFNSGTTLNVTGVPAQTIRSLTVTNSSNITLTGITGALTLSINGPTLSNNFTIDAGSTLQLTSAGASLTVNFLTTASQRGQIDGTLILIKGIFNTSSIGTTLVTVGNGGTVTNNSSISGGVPVAGSVATLTFSSGSIYNHSTATQVSVPTASYDVNSTADFTAGTSSINNMGQTFGNVTISSAGTLTVASGAPTVAGVLTLTSGVLSVGANALTLNGTMASTGTGTITASGGITIGGSGGSYGTLRFTAAPTLTSFTMNRAGSGSVTVTQAITIGTGGTLNLTNGVINSGSNLVSVTNGAAAAVTNSGGAASYINGALQRTLSANLSAATILFPVGKAACQSVTFSGLSTTNSASTAVVKVEAFDANCGGTFDPSLTALHTDNYWSASLISNPTSLSTPGTISVTDDAPVLDGTKVIASCATLAGNYSALGGSLAIPVLTSTASAPVSLGYFAIGSRNTTPLCGTYTIGPTGTFASVSQAVNSLNMRPVSCSLIFELQSTYTGAGEQFPINILYAGSASTTAIFRPEAGAGALTTAGDPGSGFALINFNGADYVTFDGRPGGSGSSVGWTIRNTRTASLVGPAIQLSNGATNDVLQYVRVESQNTTGTSGTIYISSFPLWTTGNSNITIQNCDITKYTSGTPTHINAVYAYGQTANPNSYISILNNNIHSFTPGLTSEATGVTVAGTGLNTNYGDHWTISGNSFYLDCAEQQLYRYTVINLIPGTGSTGNIISGNYIGGGAPLCAGTTWTTAVSGSGNTIQTFEGIYVKAGPTTIDGNTIQNISLTTSSSASFGAIHLADGSTSGSYTISNNLIGSTAVCNSVQNSGQWKNVGIWCDNTCGNITVSGNTIANLTGTNAVNPAATVTGIYSDCGSNTITDNLIYNLTAAIATAAAQVYIAHDASVAGIADKSVYSGTTQTISNNTIYGLKSTYSGTSNNKIYGIYTAVGATARTHTYNANLIYGFDTPNGSTNAKITGIGAVGSSAASAVTLLFSNNMIHLGIRTDGTSITSAAEITGILDNTSGYTSGANSTFMNYYYNSVYIGGTGITGTSNNTYAFRRLNTNISPKNTEDLKNNIFVNNRSNSTGTKIHYSIYLDNANTVSSNYTVGWGSGTGYKYGSSATVDYAALSNWQPATGFDGSSVSADPLFQSVTIPPDLHLQTGSPAIATGTGLSATTDLDAESRPGTNDIGADQYNAAYVMPSSTVSPCAGITLVPLPVEFLFFNGKMENKKAMLYWATASETNCDYYTIQRSVDGVNFINVGTVNGAGTSSYTIHYSFPDELQDVDINEAHIFYYRLKQTDFDGRFDYSNTIALENTVTDEFAVSTFPNPVTEQLNITINGSVARNCTYILSSMFGSELLQDKILFGDAQAFHIDLSTLNAGVYILTLHVNGEHSSQKIVRKIVKKG